MVAVQAIPSVLSLVGGVFADRFDRRRLLFVTQSLLGMSALVLGGLVMTGTVALWHVFLLAFVTGALTSINMPVQQVFVSSLVRREHLPRAVGLNALVANIGRLAGPVLATMSIEALGVGPMFLLNGVSFLAALAALWLIDKDQLFEASAGRQGGLREGLRYVRGQPELFTLLAVAGIIAATALNTPVTLPLLAVDGLGGDKGDYSTLITGTSVGSFLGATLSALRHGKPRLRAVLGGALLFGLIHSTAGFMPGVPAAAAVLALGSVLSMLYITGIGARLQLTAADSMRGRVMGLYSMLLFLGDLVTAPLIGLVGDEFGGRAPVVLVGWLAAAAALGAIAVLLRRADVVRMVGEHRIGRALAAGRAVALPVDVPRLARIGNLDRVLELSERYHRVGDHVVDTRNLSTFRPGHPAPDERHRRLAFFLALANGRWPGRAAALVNADRATRREWLLRSVADRAGDLAALLTDARARLVDAGRVRWNGTDLATGRSLRIELDALLDALTGPALVKPHELPALTVRAAGLIVRVDTLIAEAPKRGPPGRRQPAAPGPGRLRTALAPLRVRNFRLFLGGQLVSVLGSWMQVVAQDVLVLHLSGNDPVALGLATALQAAPVLLALLFGRLVDRFDKQRALIWAQVMLGLSALGLGLLTVTGQVQLWQVIYLFGPLTGALAVLETPLRFAFLPELVSKPLIPGAAGMNAMTNQLGRIAGASAVGWLVSLTGVGPMFLANALSFTVVIASLRLMDRKALLRPAPPAPGSAVGLVGHLRENPVLGQLLLLVAAVATAAINPNLTLNLLAAAFGGGAQAYGLFTSALAAGAFLGALRGGLRGASSSLTAITYSALAFAGLTLLSGLMPSPALTVLLLVPAGFASMSFLLAASVALSSLSSDAVRGRIMSLYLMASTGGPLLSAPALSWLADVFGPRVPTWLGGALALTAGLLGARWFGPDRLGAVVGRLVRPALRLLVVGGLVPAVLIAAAPAAHAGSETRADDGTTLVVLAIAVTALLGYFVPKAARAVGRHGARPAALVAAGLIGGFVVAALAGSVFLAVPLIVAGALVAAGDLLLRLLPWPLADDLANAWSERWLVRMVGASVALGAFAWLRGRGLW